MKAKRFKQLPVVLALAGFGLAAGSAQAVDFHGYFRSGEGWSDKKGGQDCFTLPGVPGNGNYRLGNECQTYGEAQFDQNMYDGKDGVKFDYHIMFAYVANQNTDFENLSSNGQAWALRQNWMEAKNIPWADGGSFWVGKRYYQRHDAHINDFFYWDTSGPGAGWEGFSMGDMKGSLAVFRRCGQYSTNIGSCGAGGAHDATTTVDFRVNGINLGAAGNLELGLVYDKADTTLTTNVKSGTALVAEHSYPLLGGVNKFILTIGTGSANAPYFAYPNNTPGTNPDQNGTTGVLDTMQWQVSPEFSGMAEVGYYKFKNNYEWTTIGVRPVYHVSDYFKVQLEVGHNAIKPTVGGSVNEQTRNLDHITIAPTVVAGRGFWTRPELRFFYTYNKWNAAARDLWGGVAGGTGGQFGTATSGSVYGFQVEAWW